MSAVMSNLLGIPGVSPKDLKRVIPLKLTEAAEETDPDTLVPQPPVTMASKRLAGREAYRAGYDGRAIAYQLYAAMRRGVPFNIKHKDRIWHPESSTLNADGTPNYETALEVRSVVENWRSGVAEIEAGREE